jgi:UDP-N-acetylmuramate--alanine ligase
VLVDPKAELHGEEQVAARLVASGQSVPGAGDRELRLRVPGRHNVVDAALAYTAAVAGLGLDPVRVVDGLQAFSGARRRFEAVGESGGVRVVDDYAHHPTEVAATIAAARTVAGRGKVHVLFQPHLYSRTRLFAEGFATALSDAATVVVLDVYGAREDPEPGVDGGLVAGRVPGARFEPDREAAVEAVVRTARRGDLVLTLGAGDVTELGPRVVEALRRRQG